MTSRKQRSLFRKTLNKIYGYAIFPYKENGLVNGTLYAFRKNRKTFKLGINPIKKNEKNVNLSCQINN